MEITADGLRDTIHEQLTLLRRWVVRVVTGAQHVDADEGARLARRILDDLRALLRNDM